MSTYTPGPLFYENGEVYSERDAAHPVAEADRSPMNLIPPAQRDANMRLCAAVAKAKGATP